ncbi:hypothetical protein IT570_03550 [Candidatus Sumerlaeota bacterium]|nr:hypothetical protein [Candidatus Sumerlaeota bacterium]
MQDATWIDWVLRGLMALLGLAVPIIGYFLKGMMSEHNEMRTELNKSKVFAAEVVKDVGALRSKVDDTSNSLVRVETVAQRSMEAIHLKQERQDDRLIDIQKMLSGVMALMSGLKEVQRDVTLIREKVAKMEGHSE